MAEPQKENRPQTDSKTGEKEAQKPGIPWFLLLLIIFPLSFWAYQEMVAPKMSEVTYSFFMNQVQDGNVLKVTQKGTTYEGRWKSLQKAQSDWVAYNEPLRVEPNPAPATTTEGQENQSETPVAAAPKPKLAPLADLFTTSVPAQENSTILRRLEEHKVDLKAVYDGPGAMILQALLLYLLPMLLIMFFFLYMMRRNSDPMNSGMFGSFVRSQAKRFKANELQTTFKDVAGMEHAKRELEEVVEFLKEPAKFQKLGAQIPKGVLLAGPPGTGKTLLARAVAGEAGVPFFSINGSEFIQMFVGIGASRVRDMFRTAKENSPCILFIDEIDAVGRIRGAGVGGGHDEREQTLNQILSEMDGFQTSEAVIVVAATNRPDVLDPALLRPGRFDRHVNVDRPSRQGRVGILKVHVRKVPLSADVDLETIATSTIGFSGADLKNLVNEAALNAARENKTEVGMQDFETARDKIMMGVAREEVLNAKERRMTAYHEAGHALIAWVLPENDPVHKVTIVPRGRALGVTQLLPVEERFHMGEKRLRSQLAMMLGGRAAEKLVFDEYSAGAESDLQRASQIARRMVSAWGMSEVIGPVAFRDSEEHPFLGKEIQEQRKFSDQTAYLIDQEMQKILIQAQKEAMELLIEYRDDLEKITDALMKTEIVSREELEQLIGPKKIDPEDPPVMNSNSDF